MREDYIGEEEGSSENRKGFQLHDNMHYNT